MSHSCYLCSLAMGFLRALLFHLTMLLAKGIENVHCKPHSLVQYGEFPEKEVLKSDNFKDLISRCSTLSDFRIINTDLFPSIVHQLINEFIPNDQYKH